MAPTSFLFLVTLIPGICTLSLGTAVLAKCLQVLGQCPIDVSFQA